MALERRFNLIVPNSTSDSNDLKKEKKKYYTIEHKACVFGDKPANVNGHIFEWNNVPPIEEDYYTQVKHQ